MSRNTCILLLVLLSACQPKVPHARNEKKIAAIMQKIADLSRNNWKTMELQNNVRSIVQFTYDKDVTDTTAKGCLVKEYYSFDTSGNTIQRIIYNNGSFDSRSVLKYNKDNKVVETAYYAEDGTLNYTDYSLFDVEGNLRETGERHATGTVRVNTFKYDDHHSVTERNIDGEVTQIKNTYDDEGVRSGAKLSFPNDIEGLEKIKYDSVGHLLEMGQYFLDGRLFTKTVSVYDEQGNCIKKTTTNEDGKKMTFEMVYDKHGNAIKGFGVPANKSFQISYEYDEMGNWTKRITRNGKNKVPEVVIRSIRYY